MMLLRVPNRIKEEKALVQGFFEDPSDFMIGSQSVSSLFSDEKSDRKVLQLEDEDYVTWTLQEE